MEGVSVPLHFPCAALVKMPEIGSDASDITVVKSTVIHHNSISSIQRSPSFDMGEKQVTLHPFGKTYIKDICSDLSFTEDVVRDRCFHMLPYSDKYFYEALDASTLIPQQPKRNILVGRHNTSGSDKRHMPCIPTKAQYLKPLKKKISDKALNMHREVVDQQRSENQASCNTPESQDDPVFLTEVDDKQSKSSKPPKINKDKHVELSHEAKEGNEKKHDWDAYLMSIISPLTANWIVHQQMTGQSNGGGGTSNKEVLSDLLEGWYGKPEHTDLIRDDISETEKHPVTPATKKRKKKVWKKEESILLEKVLQNNQEEPKARDPYSDNNEAPFYRQPVGFRKQKKKIDKEELGAINSTARDIEVKTYEPPPPPTLRDYFNPKAGETLKQTDNVFEREWLTGNEQVYQGENDSQQIVMANQNKYIKQLQVAYPDVEKWCPRNEESLEDTEPFIIPTKGARRWKSLPEPVDDTKDVLKCLPPGTEPVPVISSDAKTKKVKQQNPALSQIIDEWRSKWQLSGQFADSNPHDLLRDMADIQPHVRLKAIATVAKSSQYKAPEEDGILLEYQQQINTVSRLPEFLFDALNCLLEDKHEQVKKAAAVTLYTLNKPSDKAEEVLRELLFSESPSDRWTAAQCLAHFGVCDSDVASEVITQLLATEDSIKHEQCKQLLAKMSASTTLIHSLVAEQLNSSSWRHRVIACKIFPALDGTINKDIANKLAHLMWKDWHVEVRKVAAQSLGKTGHGRSVHDDLREKIQGSDERLKLEAISRVGHLGIMTAKLLPVLLDCFDDEYNSVRMEVCITCGNLMIKDQQVIDKLLYRATFDTVWKVKALAMQALGKIGVSSPAIKEGLTWALRYEKEGGVRAEACHTLISLQYKGDDLIEILQERLLVEEEEIVRNEISKALNLLGISSSEDIDTVAQIKCEVRKLCDQGTIASMILSNDKDEEKQRNMSRMIYQAKQELEKLFSHNNIYSRMNSKSEIDENLQMYAFKQEEVLKEQKTFESPRSVRINTDHQSQQESRLTPLMDKEVRNIIYQTIAEVPTPDSGTRASSVSTDIYGMEELSDSGSPTPLTSRSKSRISVSTDEELSDSGSPRPLTSRSTRSKSHMGRITEENEDDSKLDFNETKSDIDLKAEFDIESESDESIDDKSKQTTEIGLEDKTLSQINHGYKSPYAQSFGDMGSSALSLGGSARRRQIMSRETIREKERINAEARKSLMSLNTRYSSMMEGLKALDEGFSADKTKNISQEKEKIISNVSF